MTNLAKEFNVTKATVSDSVKVLEQKKLVSRNHVAIDNRSFRLTLTKYGKTVAQSSSIFANMLQAKVQSLSPAYKENLLVSLLEIIHLLYKSGVITAQRMCKTCRFFEQGTTEHYCSLMKQPLHTQDLRLDCPEYESGVTAAS